jgi:Domain of unknown function (DUF4386)
MHPQINPQRTARSAGILYLLMIPLGVLGIMYIPTHFIVPGDADATVKNILAEVFTFRVSIVSALAVQLVQIILVLMLYRLLKVVSQTQAALMVILILVAVPIAMLNEVNQYAVLQLALHPDYFSSLSSDQTHGLVGLFTDLHQYGVIIAQIFWGLWLLPLGYMVYKGGFIPRIIGVLLIIGGIGYLTDSIMFLLFPALGVTISTYTFIGEVLLPLWLLIKGVNVVQWQKLTYEFSKAPIPKGV